MKQMQSEREFATAGVTRALPRYGRCNLCIGHRRDEDRKIKGQRDIRAIKLRFLRWQVRADAVAFDFAITWSRRFRALVARLLMMLAAMLRRRFGSGSAIATRAVMRMVPAAPKQCMGEQQTRCQIGQ